MSKTKEEILGNHPRRTHDGILGEVGHYNEPDVHSAMDEYAAVMTVAFAEWKDGERFLYCYMGEGVYKYIHAKLGAFLPNDLYNYWIENVYKP